MRRLVFLPLVFGVVSCDVPTSVETITLQDAISSLRVKSGAGDVDLAPSEDGTISVQVTLTGKGTEFSYEVKDGELTLKKKCGFMNVGVCETDFVILAPENVAVEIDTDEGAVSVEGWQGPMDIQTGSGAITVLDSSGNLRAETGSGTIQGTEISSNHVALLGGSGEIELDVVEQEFEDILVDNGSGDVTVYLPGQGEYNLTAESNSGKLQIFDVTQTSTSSHIVKVYAGSGDITIQGQ